ncbi:hypothetical protein SDC9_193090 [bioreactor metagenome]|uniref:Uncharacterized protein n=1 Tax=bioreactor metagenome TaxID=1076179 RepID=A0A645IDM7_9ZZZZ
MRPRRQHLEQGNPGGGKAHGFPRTGQDIPSSRADAAAGINRAYAIPAFLLQNHQITESFSLFHFLPPPFSLSLFGWDNTEPAQKKR